MHRIVRLTLWVLLVGLAACGRAPDANSGGPQVSFIEPSPQRPGSMLAYEHRVEVVLPEAAINGRMQEAQSACTSAKFGVCEVLTVEQSGGDAPSAKLMVRIVPAGVEPLIALAGKDARIGSRSTRAEDLAEAVNDNTRERMRLQKELLLLQGFQERKDLAVADMVALSQRISETEARLGSAEQEGAQQRRRITTQLLTLDFRPSDGESGRGEIGKALRDFGGIFALGIAWGIRATAFLLPLALGLFVLVVVVRRLRRKKPGARA